MIDKFEGDIKLSKNVAALVTEGVRKKKPLKDRGAVTNKIYQWSYGILPYEIDSIFGRNLILRTARTTILLQNAISF